MVNIFERVKINMRQKNVKKIGRRIAKKYVHRIILLFFCGAGGGAVRVLVGCAEEMASQDD